MYGCANKELETGMIRTSDWGRRGVVCDNYNNNNNNNDDDDYVAHDSTLIGSVLLTCPHS